MGLVAKSEVHYLFIIIGNDKTPIWCFVDQEKEDLTLVRHTCYLKAHSLLAMQILLMKFIFHPSEATLYHLRQICLSAGKLVLLV